MRKLNLRTKDIIYTLIMILGRKTIDFFLYPCFENYRVDKQ